MKRPEGNWPTEWCRHPRRLERRRAHKRARRWARLRLAVERSEEAA